MPRREDGYEPSGTRGRRCVPVTSLTDSGMILAWLPLLGTFTDSTSFIRVNQVGYLPDAPKVAVVCSLAPRDVGTFTVTNAQGRVVIRSKRAEKSEPFGPC